MVKLARRFLRGVHEDTERRPDMPDASGARLGGEVGHQIFGTTGPGRDGLAFEARDEVLLERKPQIFAPDPAFTMLAPSMAGCRPRRTVSTFG